MTRSILRLALAVALTFGLAGLGLAQTDAQREALFKRIDSFATAMRTNNAKTIVEISLPPRVIERISAQANATPAQMIEATQQAMNMMAGAIISFNMDSGSARFATLADGTLYALIPTESVIDLSKIGGEKFRATESTLGLLDEGTWYLLRIDDPQQTMLLEQIYPAFAAVEFPEATREPVP